MVMDTVQWVDVPGYEKSYQISSEGCVKSLERDILCCNGKIIHHRERILKPSTSKYGKHLIVSLANDNNTEVVEIRKIMAEVFLGADDTNLNIVYKDGDPNNVCLDNLEIIPISCYETEEWLPVVGFEGIYEISNIGRVKRCRRSQIYTTSRGTHNRIFSERLMKLSEGEYVTVCLTKDGTFSYPGVHRLVAQAFIPNPENKPEVNHKDGNKHNNNVTNLEWVTSKENIQHAIQTGLSDRSKYKYTDRKPKQILCIDTNQRFETVKQCAEQFSINYSYFIQCLKHNKPCKGMHFQYVSNH